MRILFIGGTGNISGACSRLAVERGHELWCLNRGQRGAALAGSSALNVDVNDEEGVRKALCGTHFDAVVDFIAFTPEDVARDVRLFSNATSQYVFISSASAYQKPPASPVIRETTPLENPFWDYSRQKIACEALLGELHAAQNFPCTIVRPSLTYDTVIPLPLASWLEWTLVDRLIRGERIVVHGDGSSLWTITHADDFALGLLGLLGKREAVGEAFHITSDELLTWDAIHRCVARALGVEARIVHMASEDIVAMWPELRGTLLGDKAHSAIFDNTKIRKLVPEFAPRIPFAEGIAKTLAWFQERPERRRVDAASNAKVEQLLAAHDRRRASL